MINLIYSLNLLVNHSITLLYLEDDGETIKSIEFHPDETYYIVSNYVYLDTAYALLEDGSRILLENDNRVKLELQFDLPQEYVIPIHSVGRYLNLVNLCDPALNLIKIKKEG